jgi:hypothetical protein
MYVPKGVPSVLSTLGPVPVVGVAPLCLIHSILAPFSAFFHAPTCGNYLQLINIIFLNCLK